MYKKPSQGMGPWVSINEAADELGLTVEGFVSLVLSESQDIPHRYADDPEGRHYVDEFKISPLAMVSLFLIRGMYGKARDMVSKIEAYRASSGISVSDVSLNCNAC